MKIWWQNTTLAVTLGILGTGCAPHEETLNKRQMKALGAVGEGNIGSGNVETGGKKQGELPQKEFAALKLGAAKALESLKAEQVAEIELINKLSPTDIILHGKDGKAWHFKPADGSIKEIEGSVVAPNGARLYSLPDKDFWFIGTDMIGRKKQAAAGEENSGSVTVEQFSTKSLKGDMSKAKMLYGNTSEMILHLDTHIAVLSIKDGKPLLNQLEIATLPVDLKGDVQAGRMAGEGYWFRANGKLALFLPNPSGSGYIWNSGAFNIDPADVGSIGMLPDLEALKMVGESVGLQGSALLIGSQE